jgi:hypothetical protein
MGWLLTAAIVACALACLAILAIAPPKTMLGPLIR